MVIKMPCQGKPTRNTALILLSNSPYEKNESGKMIGTISLFEPLGSTARFYGYYDNSTVGLYVTELRTCCKLTAQLT
jgi:hypothetical protein